jgi:hypothetical protein
MRSRLPLAILLALLASLSAAFAADGPSFNQVKPGTFDPGNTFLVQSTWLSGIGCPKNPAASPFTCPSADPNDPHNQGLLLAKTGPTPLNASAGAELKNVKGTFLTDLGYDIRKPASFLLIGDPRGSHCGAGAPRFNVQTYDPITNTTLNHFVGCSSPAPLVTVLNPGWLRLRWTAAQLALASPAIAPTDKVAGIQIIFDEGQDATPDNFGLAILDNIDVNGTLVGQGPRHDDKDNNDRDKEGKDKKHGGD